MGRRNAVDPSTGRLANFDASPPFGSHVSDVLRRWPDISIADDTCTKHPGSPVGISVASDFGLVLVRQGGFARRVNGFEQFVDATTAFFETPSTIQESRHPQTGGDTCTVITLSESAIVAFAGDGYLPSNLVPTSPAIDLLHVGFLARVRLGADRFDAENLLTELIGSLIEQGAPGRLTTHRTATERTHRRIVDHARAAIAANPASIELRTIADDLGHTRFHISRVFREYTGSTLMQHRNRIRVAAALDRLANGEQNLAHLAVDLGFADQSHFARVLRATVGNPPSRIRADLVDAP
jgi:AraC-like DNA-binding protein